MVLRDINQFRTSSKSFNMTPIVDIVFLMIIFFLVVFQFIDAENFPVNVPDNCDYALDGQQQS
ncbi:MAG: biopolymer transporter ExbD, partial [Planctomycetes bacterium]|nr:biopolymer transporter ExbD [Planctomycetota bacterium]